MFSGAFVNGLAFRRCELAWVNGDQIGVNFLENSKGKKTKKRADLAPATTE
jgi:hypothetical protein